ncbi:hypothetical protein O181_097233 [Austropuccinia psidii MF-1]|uniref:Uncharacterized protein n=1 Tax=Austropuccinia psidii MF-1 TaxID=1389203 RepID=A0A9Q3J8I1_9BASI|nr:hypothetical protein [Austropuccinia psidii MF-1]
MLGFQTAFGLTTLQDSQNQKTSAARQFSIILVDISDGNWILQDNQEYLLAKKTTNLKVSITQNATFNKNFFPSIPQYNTEKTHFITKLNNQPIPLDSCQTTCKTCHRGSWTEIQEWPGTQQSGNSLGRLQRIKK